MSARDGEGEQGDEGGNVDNYFLRSTSKLPQVTPVCKWTIPGEQQIVLWRQGE